MNIIIITARPLGESFTDKISKKYCKTKIDKGHNSKILNLYENKDKMNFLDFEKRSKLENDFIKKCQELITWSDEIVLVFPIWNLGEPAILKNWFDLVFQSGFGFKYSEKGLHKLLIGKTAKIFVTCDAPAWKYSIIGNPIKQIWKFGRLGFCGIKLKEYISFDKMRLRDEKAREKLLKKVENIAKN